MTSMIDLIETLLLIIISVEVSATFKFIEGGFMESVHAWMEEAGLLYQIGVSLISAGIFFVVFNWWPSHRKHVKLRPVVVLDLFSVQTKLYAIFNIIMISSKNTALGPYGEKIFSGKLSRNDIVIGLQNKCLTVRDLFDKNVPFPLIPVGELLDYHTKHTEKLIDKVFNLSEYATPTEILLIEKIRNHLNEFGLSMGAHDKDLATSNCPWLVRAYWPLYKCFLDLQKISFAEKVDHPDFISSKYSYLFQVGEYRAARKIAVQRMKEEGDQKFFHERDIVECDYMLGNTKKFRAGLKALYEQPMRGPVSLKHLTMFSKDPEAQNILTASFGSGTLKMLREQALRPDLTMLIFEQQARVLSKYFASLDRNCIQVEETSAAAT